MADLALEQVKACSKCGETKVAADFPKRKRSWDGLQAWCRPCMSASSRGWTKQNRKRVNELAVSRRAKDNAPMVAASTRWNKANRDKINAADRKRYATPRGTVEGRIRRSIKMSLLRGKNGWHWEILVGYTLDDLITHLEKHFLPGMTWENRDKWHIDHIVPQSAFNYHSPDHIDFKRCWALSNLQPLWATDNQRKHAKLTAPFQPSLAL